MTTNLPQSKMLHLSALQRQIRMEGFLLKARKDTGTAAIKHLGAKESLLKTKPKLLPES